MGVVYVPGAVQEKLEPTRVQLLSITCTQLNNYLQAPLVMQVLHSCAFIIMIKNRELDINTGIHTFLRLPCIILGTFVVVECNIHSPDLLQLYY